MSSRGLEGKGLECSGLKLIIKNICNHGVLKTEYE